MNTIYLNPTDVLFFRDGRPMSGSATGHGSAWPLPHVINATFHAALHRAEIKGVHTHKTGVSTTRDEDAKREQKFGGLTTVGPFPVNKEGEWFFPRPADAQNSQSHSITLKPLGTEARPSSLELGLLPAVNTCPPTKDQSEPWLSAQAWEAYLEQSNSTLSPGHYLPDSAFSDAEHQIGIGIEATTGTTKEAAFYSASYLRLKPNWKLGVLAEAIDKVNGSKEERRDLIPAMLDTEQHLIIGGQQRSCTTELLPKAPIPLPTGPEILGTRVKWTLLTPAIFPQIGEHSGGWLPSWIDQSGLQVQLLDGPGKNKAKRMGVPQGQPIKAKLVASIVTGSLAVTGFATSTENNGAKSTHLAVPAGSVYYFEAEDETHAKKLADALNWFGASKESTTSILNRRSTLFGEKGFGLGVCSKWSPLRPSKQDACTTK
jgi:CRISPR type III-B/RAMP module-associated protein Cmr3